MNMCLQMSSVSASLKYSPWASWNKFGVIDKLFCLRLFDTVLCIKNHAVN